MCDDEQRPVAHLAVGLDAARHHVEGVDVKARVGLVENGELGLEKQQLQHLDLLALAAREAHVEVAHQVGLVEAELVAQLTHVGAEL